MSAEKYLLSVIDADAPKRGPLPSALRGFLAGCAGLYDAGLEAYLAAEYAGIRRRGRLPCPVISVGNLTVGGTGKTPMTAMLCNRLKDRGLRVTILSRGHGGTSNDARIVSTPSLLGAGGHGDIVLNSVDAGDEPVLLARLCPGVPVVVGKDRRLSGREALRNWPVDVFVLDDGFQFWQLARNLDIVLLDSKLPFDNGYPLPRGLLREPARHLRRAQMAVVTRADRLDADARQSLIDRIRAYAPNMPVHFASHAPVGLVKLDDSSLNSTFPIPHSTFPSSVVALSAIAQPGSFYRTLTEFTGCHISRQLTFADHHRFTADDAAAAIDAARETQAAAIVMTEKDAVKWPADVDTGDIPIYALRIAMQIEDEDIFLAETLKRAGL